MSAELAHLISRARDERCLLRDFWERGACLRGREQLRLAKALAEITPATIQPNGRRFRCEPRFRLRPKDRRRIAEALIADGERVLQVANAVPGISRATAYRIARERKAGADWPDPAPENRIDKRQKVSKREPQLPGTGSAYLDATSGADLEAEIRFRTLIGVAPQPRKCEWCDSYYLPRSGDGFCRARCRATARRVEEQREAIRRSIQERAGTNCSAESTSTAFELPTTAAELRELLRRERRFTPWWPGLGIRAAA